MLGLAPRFGGVGTRWGAGPCDGPPPEPFVTPLGDSLPTAANGSVAPLAPTRPPPCGPSVLRDEVFDVIHVHEPLARVRLTTVTLHVAPTVGTFHAAGRSTSYRLLAPLLRRLLDRIDERAVVSKDALALVQHHLGGEATTSPCSSTVETAPSAPPPLPTTRPAVFFLGRHEERKGWPCCSRHFACSTSTCRAGWRATGRHRPTADRSRRRHQDRVAGPRRRGGEARPLARPRSCAPRRCTASRSASC